LRQKYKEAAAELEFLGSGAHGREDLNLTDAEWKDLRELLALMKQGKVRIT
jgi:hypothetical protein